MFCFVLFVCVYTHTHTHTSRVFQRPHVHFHATLTCTWPWLPIIQESWQTVTSVGAVCVDASRGDAVTFMALAVYSGNALIHICIRQTAHSSLRPMPGALLMLNTSCPSDYWTPRRNECKKCMWFWVFTRWTKPMKLAQVAGYDTRKCNPTGNADLHLDFKYERWRWWWWRQGCFHSKVAQDISWTIKPY